MISFFKKQNKDIRAIPIESLFWDGKMTVIWGLKVSSQNPRILEWFGLEGSLRVISFHPLAICRVTSHSTRFLKAPTSLDLNTSRMGQPPLLWATCARVASPPSRLSCYMFNLNLSSFCLNALPLALSLYVLLKLKMIRQNSWGNMTQTAGICGGCLGCCCGRN